MSLADYSGPANSPEVLQHLIGETITAAFQVNAEKWLVLSSGCAWVTNANGAYWKATPIEVAEVVTKRRAEIERALAELRALPGISMP